MPGVQSVEIVRRYFDEIRNQRRGQAVQESFAADVVVHVAGSGGNAPVAGVAAIRMSLAPYVTAFPDLHFTVDDEVATKDKVAVRWTARGTHHGELEGVAATGRPVTFTGIDIYRLADGKIVEGWTSYDRLAVLQQIGAGPGAGQAARRPR